MINQAPVDEARVEERAPKVGEGLCAAEILDAPANWTKPRFDDSQWAAATEHSAREVSPKDGFDDLKLDNTVLCRVVIGRD